MLDAVRHLLHMIEDRPFESIAALIATVLYLRLMMSGPRYY